MHARVALLGVLLAAPALAGCTTILPGGGDDDRTEAAPLARLLEAHLDNAAMMELEGSEDPEDAIGRVLDAAFEYTHPGAAADAGDLTVAFRSADGQDVVRPLSDYTSQDRIEEGDVVTIDGVHPLSGMEVRRGAAVVTARDAIARDWFTAGGVPLPVAGEPGALAKWEATSAGSFDASLRALEAGGGEGEGTMRVDTFAQRFEATSTSTLEMAVDAAGRLLTVEADADAEASLFVEFAGEEDGVAAEGRLEGDGEARLDGRFEMAFDAQGAATSVGAGGSVFADATWSGHATTDGQREEFSSDDVDHPLVDESEPLEREPVEVEDVDAAVVAVLEDLWGADLAVGDRVHVFVSSPGVDGQEAFAVDYDIQVAGRGEREVAGERRAALRVVERTHVESGSGEDVGFEDVETTYWLDAESYLPLHAQGKYSQTLDRSDWDGLTSGLPPEFADEPERFQATFTVEWTLEVVEFREGLALPALVVLQGLQGGMGSSLSSMMGAFFGMPFGPTGPWGHTPPEPVHPGEPWQPPSSISPDVSFSKNEAEDYLTVAKAESGRTWDEIVAESDRFLAMNLNGPAAGGQAGGPVGEGPIQAGDRIMLCGAEGAETGVTVTLRYAWTGERIAEFTFSTVAACGGAGA